MQVSDGKRASGRALSRPSSLSDIPTEYLIVRNDGSLEWLHQNRLQEPEERRLVKSFQRKYKRTDSLKCVKHYGSLIEEDSNSEDEVDVLWENSLHERYVL